MRQAAALKNTETVPEEKAEQIFHFVKREDIEDFETCGWINTGSSLGGYHDQFGVLMQWPHGEPLRKPQR